MKRIIFTLSLLFCVFINIQSKSIFKFRCYIEELPEVILTLTINSEQKRITLKDGYNNVYFTLYYKQIYPYKGNTLFFKSNQYIKNNTPIEELLTKYGDNVLIGLKKMSFLVEDTKNKDNVQFSVLIPEDSESYMSELADLIANVCGIDKSSSSSASSRNSGSSSSSSSSSTSTKPTANVDKMAIVKVTEGVDKFYVMANVSAQNCKGKTLKFITRYFNNDENSQLKDYNGQYEVAGYVGVTTEKYCNSSDWSENIHTVIPVSELHLGDGYWNLNVSTWIYMDGKPIGFCKPKVFHMNVRNGRYGEITVDGSNTIN